MTHLEFWMGAATGAVVMLLSLWALGKGEEDR
jgi:hypothetical protein